MVVRKTNAVSIKSPINGKVVTLWSLRDGIFSMKASGDGVAILIDKDAKKLVLKSPIAGTIKFIHHMAHTIGIKNEKTGFSILLHCGTDIINPKTIGYKPLVIVDKKVKVGEPLIEINLEQVRKTEFVEHIVVTNPSKHVIVSHAHKKIVKPGEEIFAIQTK